MVGGRGTRLHQPVQLRGKDCYFKIMGFFVPGRISPNGKDDITVGSASLVFKKCLQDHFAEFTTCNFDCPSPACKGSPTLLRGLMMAGISSCMHVLY